MVLSDIHASQTVTNWSHVTVEPPQAPLTTQPLRDLREFVEKQNFKCDFLVVPGDIADQGDAAGLQYAWLILHELATALGAELVASPGNHDVVTHSDIADRSSILKNLRPTFPTGDATLDQNFWREGFTIVERGDYRFVILNSTHDFPPFPDGGKSSPNWAGYLAELDRATFSTELEERMAASLAGRTEKINVLILHHHPQEHQLRDRFKDTYGPMRRGDALISLLNGAELGRWLVIHGHKHLPQLVHVGGVVGGDVATLCAASLGAHLWKPVSTAARNLFHILDVTNDPVPGLGTLRGTVDSYYWGYGEGWKPSHPDGCGMPAQSGFGCISDPRDLAQQVAKHMDSNHLEILDYDRLIAVVPEIPYQTPDAFSNLVTALERIGYGFVRNSRQKIVQVVKDG
ncbi:metallophosphoesterase [Nocardioides sp.]|uniref:metallophosphoesterase family protein n=1 Tax=Nocardioides sp. TaxID=35761 RepID=UPI00260266A1|nr:metallophosphoesterase [Nocardioides sp.]MDI6909820.1 metallophosphoesterase [Nocardioides sp.]